MEYHDITLLLRSHATILVVETHEESRAVEMMKDIGIGMGFRYSNGRYQSACSVSIC